MDQSKSIFFIYLFWPCIFHHFFFVDFSPFEKKIFISAVPFILELFCIWNLYLFSSLKKMSICFLCLSSNKAVFLHQIHIFFPFIVFSIINLSSISLLQPYIYCDSPAIFLKHNGCHRNWFSQSQSNL